MNTFIYQSGKRGCGYACVKMALAHYSGYSGYRYLSEPPSEAMAPSLMRLISYGKEHGLTLKAYHITDISEIKGKESLPVLAMIDEDGLSHMIYVYAYRRGTFRAFDPAKGKRSFKEEDFLRIFTGVFLQKEDYIRKKEKIRKPNFLPKGVRALNIVFQVLSALSIFAGFYFVDEGGDYIFTLAFFLLFALLSVGSRSFLVANMKKFDRSYMGSVDRMPCAERRDAYNHYLAFKTGIFSREPNIVVGALVIAAFSVLLSLNDLTLGGGIVTLLFALVAELFLLAPGLRRRERELERMENGFLGGYLPQGEIRPRGEEVASRSYSLLAYLSCRNYVVMMLELVLSMACCLINSRPTLNYLLFCFMTLHFIAGQMKNLLDSLSQADSFRREEAYFIGAFFTKREV